MQQSDMSSLYYQTYPSSHYQNPPPTTPTYASDYPYYNCPTQYPPPPQNTHHIPMTSYTPNPTYYNNNSYDSSNFSGNGGLIFDDYGRVINPPHGKEGGNGSTGTFETVPKVQEEAKSDIQKFHVKLLSEGVGQNDIDVLCQIGLDGIRILDPATSRTLKIYALETVKRWEVLDLYIFAFWAKTSFDFEPRRIRLKSNSYTANNILDTVAAASIQFKEMGGSDKPSTSLKGSEIPSEKNALANLMNLMKLGNTEKDHWVPDEAVTKCKSCCTDFNAFVRKHHCRNCGDIFCDKCTQGRIALTADESAQEVRVCDPCMAEVMQRQCNAKEAAGMQSHWDLAKGSQEVMDKNRNTSTGLKSDVSGKPRRRMNAQAAARSVCRKKP